MRPHETRNDVEGRTASTIARLTAENEALRARLETVEAETRAMTDIPEDVLEAARKCIPDKMLWFRTETEANIAHALIADRAAQAERMARLEEALRNVRGHCADVAAAGMLMGSDHTETWNRLREKGKAMLAIVDPALAEAEAARALSQEGSDA